MKKRAKKLNSIKWLLVVYDLVVLLVIASLFFLLESFNKIDDFYHLLAAFVFIFFFRFLFRIYRQIWRYGGIQCYIKLMVADGCAFILFYLVVPFLPIVKISFMTMLSYFCVDLLMVLMMRMFYRYTYKCCNRDNRLSKLMRLLLKIFTFNKVRVDLIKSEHLIRIAIVGAGKTGVSLADELLNNVNASYIPRCFIDISSEKIGRTIEGLPVLDGRNISKELLNNYEIQEIVFALPQLRVEERQKLYYHYQAFGFKIKTYDYPTIQHGSQGRKQLRDFDIDELLFREEINILSEKAKSYYKDKVVLITGGGGSIGSELCRQIAGMNPKQLIILDIYENGVYDVQQNLKIKYGEKLDLRVEILSICNRSALERVFITYHPQIVLHAAAHKHVPLMEHNCIEAVENNIFGTLNCVELSDKYGVEHFIMISTDKAVNPTNVMGATKRMCEMIVGAYAATPSTTVFTSTRFGNVLGSAGSVIPLFKKQIASGGPITITDKRVTRYFMTITEASQLVLESGALAQDGELFVLDMGKPVKILDLAENMISLSGYELGKDIEIIETGLRPGEKLYEELLIKTEELTATENKLIFIEKDKALKLEELKEKIKKLIDGVNSGSEEKIREILHHLVPTFKKPTDYN